MYSVMTYSNRPNQTNSELAASIDASSAIEELTEDDLEGISGGRGHGHGRMRRHRGGHHGSGHGGHEHHESDFSKHSLSISGQTITKPDGTSITSFTMKEEDIHSHTSESIG
jgi:hypothetical protein